MDQASRLRELISTRRPSAPLRVIAVTSGKGGVGKTNASANLAVLAAREGQRVLIVDADLGLANVEIIYGMTPHYNVGHLLEGAVSAEAVLAVGPHGISVLSANSGTQALTHLDDPQKLRLITALDPLEDRYDLVIIDTGAGIGDNVVFFASAAQEVLLVVSPEPTALTDAYATVKVLSQQGGVHHFNVLVNQAATPTVAKEIFEKLVKVTDRFLSARVSYLGYAPPDHNVHRAVMAQQPVVDLFPRSPYSLALKVVADQLFGAPPPAMLDGGLKFLWQRLLRQTMPAEG